MLAMLVDMTNPLPVALLCNNIFLKWKSEKIHVLVYLMDIGDIFYFYPFN